MKTVLIYILYYTGDLISKPLFRYPGFSWLYRPYNWLMITSSNLDTKNVLWGAPLPSEVRDHEDLLLHRQEEE